MVATVNGQFRQFENPTNQKVITRQAREMYDFFSNWANHFKVPLGLQKHDKLCVVMDFLPTFFILLPKDLISFGVVCDLRFYPKSTGCFKRSRFKSMLFSGVRIVGLCAQCNRMLNLRHLKRGNILGYFSWF